jgi:hypothetical protein
VDLGLEVSGRPGVKYAPLALKAASRSGKHWEGTPLSFGCESLLPVFPGLEMSFDDAA